MVSMARKDSSDRSMEPLLQVLWDTAVDLHEKLLITDEELLMYNVPMYCRTLDEQCAPNLLDDNQFELIQKDLVEKIDSPFYTQYKKGHISLDEFSKKYTHYMMTCTGSVFRNCLNRNRSMDSTEQLMEQFFIEHERRVKLNPENYALNPCRSFIILRKLGSKKRTKHVTRESSCKLC
ncbi:unnamed protein product [Didymodactylos carnosus]|uniref:Uncharacterized protein n=1 Tax=Didymodactylos carnosus TaxID=1234261 RepID=A0A815TI63_9BILA|nr:unnamed protein product [Didymodactylos carnosus]CAF4363938.1 unnamed protein product [Didymodactylos carnosus]